MQEVHEDEIEVVAGAVVATAVGVVVEVTGRAMDEATRTVLGVRMVGMATTILIGGLSSTNRNIQLRSRPTRGVLIIEIIEAHQVAIPTTHSQHLDQIMTMATPCTIPCILEAYRVAVPTHTRHLDQTTPLVMQTGRATTSTHHTHHHTMTTSPRGWGPPIMVVIPVNTLMVKATICRELRQDHGLTGLAYHHQG